MGIPNATAQMLENQGMQARASRIMNNHHNQDLANQAQHLKNQYERELDRLQNNYRIQKNNVAVVETTAGNSIGQTHTAISIIMQLTNKPFEEVKQMILDDELKDLRCDKAVEWLKTSPDFKEGLLSSGHNAIGF